MTVEYHEVDKNLVIELLETINRGCLTVLLILMTYATFMMAGMIWLLWYLISDGN